MSNVAVGMDRPMKVALCSLYIVSAADYATTRSAINRGAVEANPILRENLWLKVPLTVGTSWGLYRLQKTKPRLALALTIGIAGAYTYCAIHNARL